MNNFNTLFHRICCCLFVLLAIDLHSGSTVKAQTTLERLEDQIRQRVNPSQEGTAPRRMPAALMPSEERSQAAYSPNSAQNTEEAEPVYLGFTADDRKDRGRGVRITDVRPGSPADKAGFSKQDLVTSLENTRVRQLNEMTDILRLYQPGDVVEFEILRAGTTQKIKVTLGRRPIAPTATTRSPETVPLPPGEMIDPENPPAKKTPSTVRTNYPDNNETIEQLQKRITELERRVAELERKLSELQKTK